MRGLGGAHAPSNHTLTLTPTPTLTLNLTLNPNQEPTRSLSFQRRQLIRSRTAALASGELGAPAAAELAAASVEVPPDGGAADGAANTAPRSPPKAAGVVTSSPLGEAEMVRRSILLTLFLSPTRTRTQPGR